jgi:hypothetical protein
MALMALDDVVRKLVGKVDPVGETSTDDVRFENLKVMCELVGRLLTDIDAVATNNKNRVEFSMKRAGEYASDFYTRIGIIE